jgi:outer membrane autotransporter protein
VIISTGEGINFEDVTSQRSRTGVRYSRTVNDYLTPYIGAAFDYEFDGQSAATTNGFRIESPSMKGATGAGEVGIKFTPSADSPFSMEVGAQGYTGKREGVTGNLMLKLEF